MGAYAAMEAVLTVNPNKEITKNEKENKSVSRTVVIIRFFDFDWLKWEKIAKQTDTDPSFYYVSSYKSTVYFAD